MNKEEYAKKVMKLEIEKKELELEWLKSEYEKL